MCKKPYSIIYMIKRGMFYLLHYIKIFSRETYIKASGQTKLFKVS